MKLAAYWDWKAVAVVPDARIVVSALGLYDTIPGCKVASTWVLMAASARGIRFVVTATDWTPWKDGARLTTLIPALHVSRQADLARLRALLTVDAERRALVLSPEEAIDLDPLACEEHGEALIVIGDDGVTPFCAECSSGEEATEMGSARYLDDIDVVFIVGLDKPIHPDWVRSILEQCRAACVPVIFLGWGSWLPEGQIVPNRDERDLMRMFFERSYRHQGGSESIDVHAHRFLRMPAARSGALLDGELIEDVPAWLGGEHG